MNNTKQFLIGGQNGVQVHLNLSMANRHGLISGATGSGKTVSLQVLAENFSRHGVPVFMSDVKGDLSGIAQAGGTSEKITQRLNTIGIGDYRNSGNPVLFWDLFGKTGHPLRTTISDLGPLLLSNLFELNETQTGILYSCFKIADDNGFLLLDMKDLRAILSWTGDNAKALRSDYSNISAASIGAIQRRLLVLEEQGGEFFFGEPALHLDDLMKTDFSGNSVISILNAKDLVAQSPRLYATFLFWLLSELFENLPETGDTDRPRLVLFFDEAHLIFDRAPRALVDKIEQVARLIRSKGVGIYFITQSPLDIPEDILGQLGMKIQHVLRAFTPKDKRVIKAVADTFRINPKLDTEQVIGELGTGEALVSVLDEKGRPTPVEQILIRPPESQIGPIDAQQRKSLIERSPFSGKYDQSVDRESAYELLKERAERLVQEQQQQQQSPSKRSSTRRSRRQSVGEAMLKSAARSLGTQIGRRLVRGILGSLLGGR